MYCTWRMWSGKGEAVCDGGGQEDTIKPNATRQSRTLDEERWEEIKVSRVAAL